jgi:uncharacterized protein
VRIVDEDYSHSLLLTPAEGVTPWPVETVRALDDAALAPIIAHEPDVVLLATGRSLRFPDRAVRVDLMRRNIGLEVMTLDAAARTFNVLAGEERRVLAALIWEPGR